MSAELWIGMAIGFTPWLLLLLIFVMGKPARPATITMDTSNRLLAERNAIGERQAVALEAIAECFCYDASRAADGETLDEAIARVSSETGYPSPPENP